MELEQALACVKAAGFRVSMPKQRKAAPALNAVGRPFSPSYDPNYRMKYKAGSIAHLFKPYGNSMRWVQS